MLELFLTFFKIGLFTFGGGYAMISLIEDICVQKKQWITHQEMMHITVVAESTPGPIAINCATYVGFRQGGFRGAVTATLGVVLPSFLIIYALSQFLDDFLAFTPAANAFRGIKLAVGILILNAGFNMLKKLPKSGFSCAAVIAVVGILTLCALLGKNLSSVALLVAAAVIALAWFAFQKKGGPTHDLS